MFGKKKAKKEKNVREYTIYDKEGKELMKDIEKLLKKQGHEDLLVIHF